MSNTGKKQLKTIEMNSSQRKFLALTMAPPVGQNVRPSIATCFLAVLLICYNKLLTNFQSTVITIQLFVGSHEGSFRDLFTFNPRPEHTNKHTDDEMFLNFVLCLLYQ